jgi:hypothetical protein
VVSFVALEDPHNPRIAPQPAHRLTRNRRAARELAALPDLIGRQRLNTDVDAHLNPIPTRNTTAIAAQLRAGKRDQRIRTTGRQRIPGVFRGTPPTIAVRFRTVVHVHVTLGLRDPIGMLERREHQRTLRSRDPRL